MVYEPPNRTCSKCGSILMWTDSQCGKCGTPLFDPPILGSLGHFVHMDVPTNYSGTVAITGSASQAMENIDIGKDYISTHPAFQNARENNTHEPLVRILDFAREVIEKQAKERVKDNPEHIEEYRKKIEEYQKLIDDEEEEPAFQTFFKNNPNFLVADQIRCDPKPKFGSEFEPDFVMESSSSLHGIIEIEKPGKKTFRKNNQPTAVFTQAETQVRDYMRWARRNIRYLRDKDPAHADREWPHITAENMRGLLVIGNKADLSKTQIEALQTINHDRPYEIKTFDDILNENIVVLENWEKM